MWLLALLRSVRAPGLNTAPLAVAPHGCRMRRMFTLARLVDNQLPGFMSEKGVWPRQLQTMVGGPRLTQCATCLPSACAMETRAEGLGVLTSWAGGANPAAVLGPQAGPACCCVLRWLWSPGQRAQAAPPCVLRACVQVVDGFSIVVGSTLGTSPLTVVAESAVGIREGGRTGITALIVALG